MMERPTPVFNLLTDGDKARHAYLNDPMYNAVADAVRAAELHGTVDVTPLLKEGLLRFAQACATYREQLIDAKLRARPEGR